MYDHHQLFSDTMKLSRRETSFFGMQRGEVIQSRPVEPVAMIVIMVSQHGGTKSKESNQLHTLRTTSCFYEASSSHRSPPFNSYYMILASVSEAQYAVIAVMKS